MHREIDYYISVHQSLIHACIHVYIQDIIYKIVYTMYLHQC